MEYVRFTPGLETITDDEEQTIADIKQVILDLAERVRQKHGTVYKGTHAKALGLVTGQLIVDGDLAPELAQGLFSAQGSYAVAVRYASGPPEKLSDKASGQRGMAVKVLGVTGPHLADSDETTTQDFVLAVDPAFVTATAKSFLNSFKNTGAQSPHLSEGVIIAGSRIARGLEAVLETVGTASANLKFYGRPPRHPLSDIYYSQAPIRYGDYVAKIAMFPTQDMLDVIGEPSVDTSDDDVFRHVTQEYFSRSEARYDVKVQLCKNLNTMPIEDASVVWPEDASPYRKVATLVLPIQNAYTAEREAYFDDRLAFNPVHSLKSHQPLGSIMRARIVSYVAAAEMRRRFNGVVPAEPRSLSQIPD